MQKTFTIITALAIPFFAFSSTDTLPTDKMEKAIRIEYNLFIPDFDPLIDYSSLPYKKVLTIHKGEALLEGFRAGHTGSWKTYYDLDLNFFYTGFSQQYTYKTKWIKWGRTMAESKKAAHTVAGKACKAFQIVHLSDTLLVFATDEFGLDFYELGEIEGLALEYEIPYVDGKKLKYRAAKIDTVLLAQGQLADLNSFNIQENRFNSKRALKRGKNYQRYLERTKKKMIGAKAPGFKVRDMFGNKVRKKDFHGKIMVLHFWSFNSQFSLKEFPVLNKVVEKYSGNENVAFVSFPNLNETGVRRAMKIEPLYYVVCPSSFWVAERYKAPTMPLHVVVDQTGKVREYIYGRPPDIAKKLIAAIDALQK